MVVLLNADDKNRYQTTYPTVPTAIHGPKMGKTYPKAVITSPDMTEIWMVFDYPDLQKEKTYRDARKKIKEIVEGKAKIEAAGTEPFHWLLKGSNNYYTGRFVSFDKTGRLLLEKSPGETIRVQPEKLCPGALAYAKLLDGKQDGATAAQPAAAEPAAAQPVEEEWHSSDGKTIRATFISLAGDKLTLLRSDGKQFEIPLSRLSQSSQTHARELVGSPGG